MNRAESENENLQWCSFGNISACRGRQLQHVPTTVQVHSVFNHTAVLHELVNRGRSRVQILH